MSDITGAIFILIGCSLAFVIYGVVLCLSKHAIKFNDFESYEDEQIKDIRKWNGLNGLIWIVYGLYFLIFELLIVCLIKNPLVMAVIAFIAAVGPVFYITKIHDKIVDEFVTDDSLIEDDDEYNLI